MNLLTDNEIAEIAMANALSEYPSPELLSRAIEAAVLEKLCAGVEMPEAVMAWEERRLSPSALHMPDQLRAYGAAQRLKALSEALEIADNCADADMHSSMAANAIRALKGEA